MSFARPARAALDTAGLAEVERDVADARAVLDATSRRVATGQDSAAALATAEYRHHLALRRLDEVRARWTSPEGPEAAA